MLDVLPLLAIILGAEGVDGGDYSFPHVSGTLSLGDSYVTALAGAGAGAGAGGGAFQGGPSTALAAGRWSVRGGIGFTTSPELFLMGLELDYNLFQNFGIGPLVQVGVTDKELLVAPTVNAQYAFNIPRLDRLKPFIQGGIGFAYRNNEDCDCNEDTGFLVNFGPGVDWFLAGNLAVGSSALFNFMPGDVLDDDFFFSWQVVTLRWVF